MRLFLIAAAISVSACAVFNPNNVNLNPFRGAGHPCPALFDGDVHNLNVEQSDEEYCARQWRRLHPSISERLKNPQDPEFTPDEEKKRLESYTHIPGW